jgi:hypothetical protein
MQTNRANIVSLAVLLLGALPFVTAHGGGHAQTEQDNVSAMNAEPQDVPPTYFRHPDYAEWMYAHIAFMIVGWVVVLPPALMLSVVRSRYHLPAQLLFHVVNALGLFAGFVYNHSTPDLYVTNSHHPAGWAVAALTITWTILSLTTACAPKVKRRELEVTPKTFDRNFTEDGNIQQYLDSATSYRFSRDSGNFSAGSRANSSESVFGKPSSSPSSDDQESGDWERHGNTEESGFLGRDKNDNTIARVIRLVSGQRMSSFVRFSQVLLDKAMLLLGFLAITTGFVVYGGLFQKREIFSGLAHFVKGGIFFWYGLLTLGRWMGAFADYGWAWNVRPEYPVVSRWKSRIPSAEFTESFVIWLYGASNVFLEHLNNWGGKWSPQDFEHVSITILFFGGGLFGMMIESRAWRELTSAPVWLQKEKDNKVDDFSGFRVISEPLLHSDQRWQRPSTYGIPLNPMPALTIMFLGMMMSGHHQSSMVSSMMHAQWGMLFAGFAVSRALTYLMLYIKPPTSHYPSRPPSELVAAFCLTAGGILFMNSAHDSVAAIEANGLDAMTIFTLTVGLTGILLAWELVCFMIKGWAVRKEQSRADRR